PPRQSQPRAPPVRVGRVSDQRRGRFKRLNGLCRGAAGCRLKFREGRRGPGERVGTREEAERHPLGRTEFAVIPLSLYEPSHLQRSSAVSRADIFYLSEYSSVSKLT